MADTLKYTADLVVRYFITKNRRTPFAALYGQWQRGNFAKVCAAGHCLYQRAATPDEINAYANRPRELGFSYPNFTAMVREVSIIDGPVGRKNFMKNVRYYRTAIEVCLQIVGKKRDKHEAKQQGYKQKRHETKMKERAKIQPLLFNLPSTSFSLKEVENTKSLKRAKTKKRFTQLSLF